MAGEVMGSRASTLLAHEKDLSPFFTRVQGQGLGGCHSAASGGRGKVSGEIVAGAGG